MASAPLLSAYDPAVQGDRFSQGYCPADDVAKSRTGAVFDCAAVVFVTSVSQENK